MMAASTIVRTPDSLPEPFINVSKESLMTVG